MNPLVSLYYFAPVCAAMNVLIALVWEVPKCTMAEVYNVGLWVLLANAGVAFALNVSVVFLVRLKTSFFHSAILTFYSRSAEPQVSSSPFAVSLRISCSLPSRSLFGQPPFPASRPSGTALQSSVCFTISLVKKNLSPISPRQAADGPNLVRTVPSSESSSSLAAFLPPLSSSSEVWRQPTLPSTTQAPTSRALLARHKIFSPRASNFHRLPLFPICERKDWGFLLVCNPSHHYRAG